MKKKIVAIGGGENGRFLEDGNKTEYETEILDKEIIKLTEKEKPNYLFIAHAMCFSDEIQESYYDTMKKIYDDKYGCDCMFLKSTSLYDTNLVKEMVEWADIIYEGGGDTSAMIKLWKETGFDTILKYAWQNGKVICGISAGAVCWFNSCNSDIDASHFEVTDCLNWFDVFIVPHCDEDGRYESAKKQLRENQKVGLMLSNCSAIEIINNKYKIICADTNKRKFKKGYVLKCYWQDDRYYEEKLEENNEYKMLSELFCKNIVDLSK